MPNNVSTRPIYSSFVMLHPDGTPMSRVSKRKAFWFVNRGFANWEGEDKKCFRLNFEPQGRGRAGNDFYMQERENICVCCGSAENLNRHHVFPRVFRKYMPLNIKSGNSHDVLPICIDCHEAYEVEGDKLKDKILEERNIPKHSNVKQKNDGFKVVYQARKMLERLGDKNFFVRSDGKVITIPENIIQKFKEIAAIEAPELTEEDKSHWGEVVVNQVIAEGGLQGLQAFVERWRQHFVDVMKPKHLPPLWAVNTKLELIGRIRLPDGTFKNCPIKEGEDCDNLSNAL